MEVDLPQGCVKSLWLFTLFMYVVMREMQDSTGEIGVRMIDDRSKHDWIIEQLMFADDPVPFGDDEKKLQELVNEFGRVCFTRLASVFHIGLQVHS